MFGKLCNRKSFLKNAATFFCDRVLDAKCRMSKLFCANSWNIDGKQKGPKTKCVKDEDATWLADRFAACYFRTA